MDTRSQKSTHCENFLVSDKILINELRRSFFSAKLMAIIMNATWHNLCQIRNSYKVSPPDFRQNDDYFSNL